MGIIAYIVPEGKTWNRNKLYLPIIKVEKERKNTCSGAMEMEQGRSRRGELRFWREPNSNLTSLSQPHFSSQHRPFATILRRPSITFPVSILGGRKDSSQGQ
jgi:hypothetical protein